MSNKTIESIKKRKAKGDLGFGDYTRDYYELHVVRLLRAAGCNPVSHNSLGVLYAWLIPGSLYKYPVYLKGNGDVHLHKDLYAFYWNLESRERHGLPQNPVPVARSHAPDAEHYDHTDPVLPLPDKEIVVTASDRLALSLNNLVKWLRSLPDVDMSTTPAKWMQDNPTHPRTLHLQRLIAEVEAENPTPIPLPTVDFEVSPDELSSFKLPRRTDG